MSTVRIVLADDHTLVRTGFRSLLRGVSDFAVVGEADNGRDAVRLIEQLVPDVAIVDISMPGLNGLETTTRVVHRRLRTRVIILSMHADEEYVRQAFASGAAGYVLKNASEGELELAVRAAARGDSWLSAGVTKPVLAAYASGRAGAPGPFQVLTPRQREVLQLIAEGHSTTQIAKLLGLSGKTVESHRSQVMERLQIRTVQGLVRYAVRKGIVPADP